MNSIMKATQKLSAGRVQLRNAAAAAVAPAGTPLQRENILERLRKREERMRLKRGRVLLDAQAGLRIFEETLAATGTDGLMYRVAPKTIQVNIGLLCNQSCHHCHVSQHFLGLKTRLPSSRTHESYKVTNL
ncbi:hypothetical protein DIPPA_09408 [Diplonema papillatum]|nr:hypothetical protein DIPPA_09408 [Diplonema papillatum]